jgi:uncharacterized protein (TIGR02300 family)
VVKPAWGMKRTCQGCGAHFYDLQKDPIICPKCATVYDPDAVSRTRRGRSSSAAPKAAPRVPVPEIAEAPGEPVAPELEEAGLEIAADEGEAEGEDVTIEDTEDLPEDDGDVTEVIENVEEEER